MLLSYEEYRSFGGKLDNTAFAIFCYEAEMRVNAETHGRIKKDSANEAVKRCIARLTDILASSDISKEKVSSYSNDGVSQSFVNRTSEDFSKSITSTIRTYLANEVDSDGVPLLYLGVH